MSHKTNANARRLFEWVAALIGALNCVLVSITFAQLDQPMWPLPGLYLIEIALTGLVVAIYVAIRPRLEATGWNALPWLAAGFMLAFVILGGFSIGLFLIPALVAFIVTGLLIDFQTSGSTGAHIGLFFVAALIQGAVMGLALLIN